MKLENDGAVHTGILNNKKSLTKLRSVNVEKNKLIYG